VGLSAPSGSAFRRSIRQQLGLLQFLAERQAHFDTLFLFNVVRRRGADVAMAEVLTSCLDAEI
jgi:hypothetical protein